MSKKYPFIHKILIIPPFFSGLAPRVFYKLQELKMLDLSNNRIQFIDGATFVDIPDIEVFRCDNCQLFQVKKLIGLFEIELKYRLITLHILSKKNILHLFPFKFFYKMVTKKFSKTCKIQNVF